MSSFVLCWYSSRKPLQRWQLPQLSLQSSFQHRSVLSDCVPNVFCPYLKLYVSGTYLPYPLSNRSFLISVCHSSSDSCPKPLIISLSPATSFALHGQSVFASCWLFLPRPSVNVHILYCFLSFCLRSLFCGTHKYNLDFSRSPLHVALLRIFSDSLAFLPQSSTHFSRFSTTCPTLLIPQHPTAGQWSFLLSPFFSAILRMLLLFLHKTLSLLFST